ncbi:MAG: glycyl-radical enzyme activating protein [Bacteroidales bacterium]|jgi:pyruvate formate lyase activating enzyme
MEKILITKIVKDSVLDGPGCRYVVFVKGCNLNCPWCHNPETKSPEQEIFTYSKFCIHCGECVKASTSNSLSDITPVVVDNKNAKDFFRAVEECPTNTLEYAGTEYSTDDIISDMQKFNIMYSKTKGGLTISGGDPLFVSDFSFELFKKAKDAGFHTAADTALTYKYDLIEKFIPVVNLWLIDLKHTRDKNVKSDLVIENLLKLSKKTNIHIWIRVPVIPDYNDTETIWNEMALILKEAGKAIEQVSLLPFHPYGLAKYEALNFNYKFAKYEHLNNDVIENAKKIFSKYLNSEILTTGKRILQG